LDGENRDPLNFRTELFERVKKGPAAIQVPLRMAWRLWKEAREAFLSLSVLPRAVARWNGEKRVLGIFHFQEHAAFLGDMMEFLAILNVLRVESGFDKVDLCYVDDPSNPNRPVSRDRLESSPEFKETMLALRALLPSTGAVYQFDSDPAFERFFRAHYRRYVCWPRYGYFHSWPSRVDYSRLSDRGLAFPNTYIPLVRFFDARGTLPMLTCPPALLEWARNFVQQHVSPAVPVAVQIRINADSPRRNTDIDAWKEFFRRMEARSDIKFILLCRREEIVPELRSLRNIIYSKDHAADALHDLALIQVSHLSMFPDAGFATFPWFCGLPSIFFGKQKHEFAQRRMLDEDGKGLRFLSPFQRRQFGEYTADTLEAAFWSLWNDLAAAGWQNPYRVER
jgi:hypothetical protein